MSFRLCNAPATFQRCMLAIFADLVEKCIEAFMDDFSVFGPSFECCLTNLELVLQRCVETNLVLNWEKCHFMVQEGFVLGNKILSRRIEVVRKKLILSISYLHRWMWKASEVFSNMLVSIGHAKELTTPECLPFVFFILSWAHLNGWSIWTYMLFGCVLNQICIHL